MTRATTSPQTGRPVFPLVTVLLLLVAGTANAALTTDKCLVQKRQAWSTLRKCQATADVKRLKGKPADLQKCQSKFQEKLASIASKATKAAIACRFGANGDGTVTDYDTGLMWEMKDGEVGGPCFVVAGTVSHCVNALFNWPDAHTYVSGTSTNGLGIAAPFLAGRFDWRLPTIDELRSLVVAGCPAGSPCIDPIFGPTAEGFYWSSTTDATFPSFAWGVSFFAGNLDLGGKNGNTLYVRAVRADL